ncbi:MAG: glycosyltransferase family 2 protein, partial [Candidatus Eisenbacteria bacterium]|nr:glycosyltransferase family 2 protein [Candidatus Eisenbacteria bacterium]
MSASPQKRVSIVTPVFNESATIDRFHEQLAAALAPLSDRYAFEILYSDNASIDDTRAKVAALRARDPRVQLLALSRNFGYQASMVAGMKQASGDAIVFIDGDGEDPPALLARFLAEWEAGHDVVYGIRERRHEPPHLSLARKIFYRVNKSIADSDILVDVAEFGLIAAEVRDAVVVGLSTFPFIRAEIAHYGFRRIGIKYDRNPRLGGQSHFNAYGMMRFAVAGILTSTTVPLRLALYGLPTLVLANALLLWLDATGRWPHGFEVLVAGDLLYIATALAFVALYTGRNYR